MKLDERTILVKALNILENPDGQYCNLELSKNLYDFLKKTKEHK